MSRSGSQISGPKTDPTAASLVLPNDISHGSTGFLYAGRATANLRGPPMGM